MPVPRSLVDRLLDRRDRLLASPRFQSAAARFLPTRFIARRRSRALFDLVAGFTYSQVLFACVKLGLFDLLLVRPRDRTELAAHARLDDERVERLLAAAIALGLVERRSGARYGLGPLGAPLAGNRAIAAMVEHHAALYADLADPVALLRRRSGEGSASMRVEQAPTREAALQGAATVPSTVPSSSAITPDSGTAADGQWRTAPSETTRLGAVWGYAANDAARALDDTRVAAYSRLMTASQPLVAAQILDAYPLRRHRVLMDVGGGEGTFAIAVARRYPHLALRVFDLPAVADRARAANDGAGLAQRITAFGGDFVREPLPGGADIVTLVRVVHDHDDPHALQLLRAVHAALPDGGVLLLAEPMSGTAGAEPMGDAYFGMYLLAMGSGRPRTAERLEAMLVEAGFSRVRPIATALPLQTRILVATR